MKRRFWRVLPTKVIPSSVSVLWGRISRLTETMLTRSPRGGTINSAFQQKSEYFAMKFRKTLISIMRIIESCVRWKTNFTHICIEKSSFPAKHLKLFQKVVVVEWIYFQPSPALPQMVQSFNLSVTFSHPLGAGQLEMHILWSLNLKKPSTQVWMSPNSLRVFKCDVDKATKLIYFYIVWTII